MNNLEKLQIPTPQDQQGSIDKEHVVTVYITNHFNICAICTEFTNIVNGNLHPNQSSLQVKAFDFKNADGGIDLTAKFRCLASAHSAYKELGKWVEEKKKSENQGNHEKAESGAEEEKSKISAHTNKL